MKRLFVAIGAVAALVGSVWALQGAGVLLGSSMSNDPTWLWIGIALVVIGLALVGIGLRSRSKKAAKPPSSGSRTE
ncbi:MAG TPA: hypothetical protein VIB49_05320 [Thermoplasmata archaeon]